MEDGNEAMDQFKTLVADACTKHKSIDGAHRYIMSILNGDTGLLESIMSSLVDQAVREHIHRHRHYQLNQAKNISVCKRPVEAMDAAAEASAMSLLDTWTLPDGTMLGDVLGKELPPIIEAERNLAHGHTCNAAFLAELRKRTPDRAKVRSKVTPKQAMELWRKISGQREAA